ncbi:MAG: CoA transferase [Nitrospinota bacterium]|jgi:formyl-CoA transferase|nr:CoA transferase [Nitrospinota bacterium]
MSDDATGPPPLESVKVLDLSNYLAAPMATMYLADYGAEVIKIEQPGRGDGMRMWGNNKNGIGLYFKVINRNKKSVTLDFHTPFGVRAVKALAENSDVVVENFRPGVLDRWGLGYEILSEINPRIIMLSITGFGQTGPNKDRPGFGSLAEAYAGFSHINGEADGPPMSPSWGLGDSSTGIGAAFLVMAALYGRECRGGRGQHIDMAIYEQLFTMLGPQVINYDQLGLIQGRSGSRLSFAVPRNNFKTRDGKWILIAGSNQSIFENICRGLGREDLIEDSRFLDNRARMKNPDALEEELQKTVGKMALDEVMGRLIEYDGAATPINDVKMVTEDPQIIARESVTSVNDEEFGGPVRMQNVVGKLSRTPGSIRHAGPRLGHHNREILIERLGFDEEEVKEEGLPL